MEKKHERFSIPADRRIERRSAARERPVVSPGGTAAESSERDFKRRVLLSLVVAPRLRFLWLHRAVHRSVDCHRHLHLGLSLSAVAVIFFSVGVPVDALPDSEYLPRLSTLAVS
jgi:hypothetical protein